MRNKFERDMWLGGAAALFAGNQEQYPASFLVLGVFWPPDNGYQPWLLPRGSSVRAVLPRECHVDDHLPVAGRIYSVGYEGMTLDGLIDRLTDARVCVLVDVRLNPISRKPGFSRVRLAKALEEAGVA